jgi:hypothetical protein
LLIYYFDQLSKTTKFSNCFGESAKEAEKKIEYKQVWQIVKKELVLLYLVFFLSFLVYPGIVFSSFCVTIKFMKEGKPFSKTTFTLIMNIVLGAGEILGRLITFSKHVEIISNTCLCLLGLCSTFLIFQYFQSYYLKFENMAYVMFFNGFFIVFTIGCASAFYVTKANIVGAEYKEGVGSFSILLLLSGIATGNLISISFPALKGENII